MRVKMQEICTVGNCRDVYETLIQATQSDEQIDLDLSAVQEADCSFFILLHGTLKSCPEISILSEMNDHIKTKLQIMGLV